MNQYFIDANGNYFVAIEPINTPLGSKPAPPRPDSSWLWSDNDWIKEVPSPIVLSQEELSALRLENYSKEADPLFFKWQRDEATEQEWLDKVEEIKLRFPYPEETV